MNILHNKADFNIPKTWMVLNHTEVGNEFCDPNHNSLVVAKINNNFHLVYIVDGAYIRNGRISNAWTIKIVKTNKTLSKEISFLYGNFYEYKGPLKIKTTITHKII